MKKLVKTAKGSKWNYQVVDENGNVLASRTSKREYVACSANGDFFFGRIDLVGKGFYSKSYDKAQKYANYTEEQYIADRVDFCKCFGLKNIDKYYPIKEEAMKNKIEETREYGKKWLAKLEIVYIA